MTREPQDDPKKSDTLQIRIPHETKKEFLEACRKERVTASDLLRNWIVDFLAARRRPSLQPAKGLIAMIPRPIRKRRYLLAGAAVAGAAALVALPSAAETFRTMFDQLDANRDGKVTELEFMAKAKSSIPQDVRDRLIDEIRKAITEPYDPEKSRLGLALHEALRRGDRTVESLAADELEKIGRTPKKMPEERLERIKKEIRESIGKPRRKEYLPPQNPQLHAKVQSGERTVESLSQQELLSLIPVWNDKDYPIHGVSAAHAEPTDPCSGPGISDAEFANPWMNSNPYDMRRMYIRGDRNKDGLVTFEEFQVSQMETARLWFSSMDHNGDGVLSNPDYEMGLARYEEFKQAGPNDIVCPPKGRPRWVPLDTDSDGKVTFEEYLIPAQLLDPR